MNARDLISKALAASIGATAQPDVWEGLADGWQIPGDDASAKDLCDDAADAVLSALRSAGMLVDWRPIEEAPMPTDGLHTLPYLIGRAKPPIVGMGRTTKALGSDRTFIEPITVNINPFAPITHFALLPPSPEQSNEA